MSRCFCCGPGRSAGPRPCERDRDRTGGIRTVAAGPDRTGGGDDPRPRDRDLTGGGDPPYRDRTGVAGPAAAGWGAVPASPGPYKGRSGPPAGGPDLSTVGRNSLFRWPVSGS